MCLNMYTIILRCVQSSRTNEMNAVEIVLDPRTKSDLEHTQRHQHD